MRKNLQSKKVLIVRNSAIGEILIASPLAEKLKEAGPNTEITWLINKSNAQILENNPYIDKLILWDPNSWDEAKKKLDLRALIKTLLILKKQLAAEKFDIAIDLQSDQLTSLLVWLSGAKQKIGIGSREGGYRMLHRLISRNIANQELIGSDYRYLLNQLGMDDNHWQMRIHPTEQARQNAQSLLKESGIPSGSPYAVILPFTTHNERNWPDDNWQQLILRIRGRHHLKTVILGSKNDTTSSERIAKRCGGVCLAGKTSIHETTHILEGAKLTIGVDNGFTHLAQSLAPPSIALFGATRPYLYTGNLSSKVIYLGKECSPCGGRPICEGAFNCMKDISPDKVLAELKSLLKYCTPLNK